MSHPNNNDRNFYVEDYAPSSYRNIGDQTVVPVYIKPYRKSNSQLSYTICIKKDFETRGESFCFRRPMLCHGSLLYPVSFIFQCDCSHFCPSGASALYLTPLTLEKQYNLTIVFFVYHFTIQTNIIIYSILSIKTLAS